MILDKNKLEPKGTRILNLRCPRKNVVHLSLTLEELLLTLPQLHLEIAVACLSACRDYIKVPF